MIIKMAAKMAGPCGQFALVDTPNLSHLSSGCFQISFMDYFDQTLAKVRT